mgnify:CR=1 FL=1
MIILVMKVRLYYIFSIKDNVSNLYQNDPVNLYKILENIYFMSDDEIDYGYNLFKQIANMSDYQYLNNQLYIKLHKDITYSKINNEHIINDLYHDEISILKIKSSRMILESNKSYSSFFKVLNKINKNYFVCDFKEKDFFFINSFFQLVKK